MSPLGTFLRGGTTRPNAAPELRITLARRLVETQAAPFVPTRETFTDVASALDELGLLPAAQGPTVVRVQVEGGTDEDHEALAGDWLVDPDGDERVLYLPTPQWTHDDAAIRWARARPWLEAWETCQDGAWMLSAAAYAALARPLLVLAACACARTALHLVPSGEERPLRAIEAAERWTRGEATIDEAQDAANAAWTAYQAFDYAVNATQPTAAAAAAVASAASAASTTDTTATYILTAAWAPSYAARASATSTGGFAPARAAAIARCADLVRGVIPTLVVLRAVVATRA